MFGKRRRARSQPYEVYLGLRQQILTLDPADAAIAATADLPQVWGSVIDMSRPNGSVTLVGLADGTTSMYTSSGGGILGAGAHPHVAAATQALLRTIEQHLNLLSARADADLPGPGRVTIRALTYGGQFAVEDDEAVLGKGHHPASPVYDAVHDMITQLRIADQAQPR